MGLIRLNFRHILNLNFLFMSAVATILGFISLLSIGNNMTSQMFGIEVRYIMLDGYACLFIFFAGEISKDLLQQEKITRRLEWKLANGIKIGSILREHTVILWLGTLLLLAPLFVLFLIKTASFSLTSGINFVIVCLLYSAITNVLILRTKNMNRFKSLPIIVTLWHILLVVVKYALYYKTENQIFTTIFFLVALVFIMLLSLVRLTKERIVSAYY